MQRRFVQTAMQIIYGDLAMRLSIWKEGKRQHMSELRNEQFDWVKMDLQSKLKYNTANSALCLMRMILQRSIEAKVVSQIWMWHENATHSIQESSLALMMARAAFSS